MFLGWGGTFSVIESRLVKEITSGSYTFDLIDEGSEYAAYNIAYDGEEGLRVFGNDGALNGAKVSWNFPARTEFNSSTTLPNWKTTQEQLADVVPYIEFITDASGNVTGYNWRVVNPSDTSTPVSKDLPMRLTVSEICKPYNNNIYSSKNFYINSGEVPSGAESLDDPVPLNEISKILLRLRITSGDEAPTYTWQFFDRTKEDVTFWCNQINHASLINGKANYNKAEFERIFFDVYDDDNPSEGSSFVEGKVTIPGIGYTLINDRTVEALGVNIPAGEEKTFSVKMYYDVGVGYYYSEYEPYSGDIPIAFGGSNAETGFNGKTIKFEFPAELKSMDITTTVPTFKSVNEQLNSFVPYVELVSADGKVTGMKYRLVKSSDTSTALTPANTEIILYYYPKTQGRLRTSWQSTLSGTWNFETPQDLNDFESVSVRVRPTGINPANIDQLYQWKFLPAEEEKETAPKQEPEKEEPGKSGGGGCEVASSLCGILLISAAMKIFNLRKKQN